MCCPQRPVEEGCICECTVAAPECMLQAWGAWWPLASAAFVHHVDGCWQLERRSQQRPSCGRFVSDGGEVTGISQGFAVQVTAISLALNELKAYCQPHAAFPRQQMAAAPSIQRAAVSG